MRAHWKYLKYVLRHKWLVLLAGWPLGVPLLTLILHDWDKFKRDEWFAFVDYFHGEKIPDPKWSVFDSKTGKSTPKMNTPVHIQEAWDQALNLHYKRNRHHWQFYVLTPDKPRPRFGQTSHDDGMSHAYISRFGGGDVAIVYDMSLEWWTPDWDALRELDQDFKKAPVILEMPEVYAFEMLADWYAMAWASGNPHPKAWYLANRSTIFLHPKNTDVDRGTARHQRGYLNRRKHVGNRRVFRLLIRIDVPDALRRIKIETHPQSRTRAILLMPAAPVLPRQPLLLDAPRLANAAAHATRVDVVSRSIPHTFQRSLWIDTEAMPLETLEDVTRAAQEFRGRLQDAFDADHARGRGQHLLPLLRRVSYTRALVDGAFRLFIEYRACDKFPHYRLTWGHLLWGRVDIRKGNAAYGADILSSPALPFVQARLADYLFALGVRLEAARLCPHGAGPESDSEGDELYEKDQKTDTREYRLFKIDIEAERRRIARAERQAASAPLIPLRAPQSAWHTLSSWGGSWPRWMVRRMV